MAPKNKMSAKMPAKHPPTGIVKFFQSKSFSVAVRTMKVLGEGNSRTAVPKSEYTVMEDALAYAEEQANESTVVAVDTILHDGHYFPKNCDIFLGGNHQLQPLGQKNGQVVFGTIDKGGLGLVLVGVDGSIGSNGSFALHSGESTNSVSSDSPKITAVKNADGTVVRFDEKNNEIFSISSRESDVTSVLPDSPPPATSIKVEDDTSYDASISLLESPAPCNRHRMADSPGDTPDPRDRCDGLSESEKKYSKKSFGVGGMTPGSIWSEDSSEWLSKLSPPKSDSAKSEGSQSEVSSKSEDTSSFGDPSPVKDLKGWNFSQNEQFVPKQTAAPRPTPKLSRKALLEKEEEKKEPSKKDPAKKKGEKKEAKNEEEKKAVTGRYPQRRRRPPQA